MPNWFKNKEDDPDLNQGEFKPEEFKTQLTSEFENKFTKFQSDLEEKNKPLIEMANAFRASQEAAAARQREEKQRKTLEDNVVDDDLWITNPKEAYEKSSKGLLEQQQAIAAITMRREILSNKEYYYGDVKDQIDQLIDAQPLHLRANAGVLTNAYYTVIGRRSEEIAEGKLKKQTFGATFGGGGTGSDKGDKTSEQEEKLSDEEATIARKFGMSDKEWIASKQEMSYV